jgi:hypothetical protein
MTVAQRRTSDRDASDLGAARHLERRHPILTLWLDLGAVQLAEIERRRVRPIRHVVSTVRGECVE